MDTYLTFTDQSRYILGTLAVLLLLCHGILPILFIRFCYQICWAGVLFRSILCISAENFMTAVVYYLISKILFPEFSSNSPVAYALFLSAVYSIFIVIGWLTLRRILSTDENRLYRTPSKTARAYLFAYVSMRIMFFASELCFEFIITPLADSPQYSGILGFLQYYLTLNLILLSVAVSFIMISAYQTLTLQNENQIILRMIKDRQTQYEFSKENIEMINRNATASLLSSMQTKPKQPLKAIL